MKTGLTRKITSAALISVFGMAFAVPSFAAGDSSGASGPTSQTKSQASNKATQGAHDVRGSKLIGTEVKNAEGENLGEIKDLIVDVGDSRVRYAVLSFGGIAGIGDKLFAYPISAFKPSSDGDKLVLNVSKDRLKNAPGFDKDKWPDWTDNRYRGDVDKYFKATTAKAGERLVRASQLIGKNVEDRKGANAGEIKDIVVSLSDGRIPYVVLDFDKSWSPDDKLLPLPLSALKFPTDKDKKVVLNVDKEKLDMARGFDDKNWPDLNSAEYRRDVRKHVAALDKPAPRAARTGEATSGASTSATSKSGAAASGATTSNPSK
jgi:sporulation protein YlmC with PRC-barrel domain